MSSRKSSESSDIRGVPQDRDPDASPEGVLFDVNHGGDSDSTGLIAGYPKYWCVRMSLIPSAAAHECGQYAEAIEALRTAASRAADEP